MVTILALAAAVLYGTADFLGGVASRRASVFAVLAMTVPAGAVVVRGRRCSAGPGWTGCWAWPGLVIFDRDGTRSVGRRHPASAARPAWSRLRWLHRGPDSVVAPVAALVSTVLPVGVAIAGGERLTARMWPSGADSCLVAIAGVSMPAARRGRQGTTFC